MSIVREDFGSVTGIKLSQLFYNANKTLLGSITTYNGSYTATQDCVMYCKCVGDGTYSPIIYFNGVVSLWSYGTSGSKYSLWIGYENTSSTAPTLYGIFIPKGTVVTTRNRSSQTYDVRFYSLD